MASSEQINALLKSHLERDEDRFLSIELQVAAHEARSGHGKLAQELGDIVEKAAVDNGFDRRLQRQADILRFRSTHHAGEVLVSLTRGQTGIGVWVGREVFSVRLLDLAGVELREPPASCPWKETVVAPSVLVSLKVTGVAGVRRLFSLLHQTLTPSAVFRPQPGTADVRA